MVSYKLREKKNLFGPENLLEFKQNFTHYSSESDTPAVSSIIKRSQTNCDCLCYRPPIVCVTERVPNCAVNKNNPLGQNLGLAQLKYELTYCHPS